MARSALREQFYSDMLTDSWSAVSYWWSSETTPNQELSTDDIARGWQALIKREHGKSFFHCGCKRPIAEAELGLVTNERQGYLDYDDCVVDAVIQLAVLGDLVYG